MASLGCKKCGGRVLVDYGELVCCNCGMRYQLRAMTPVKRHKKLAHSAYASVRLDSGLMEGREYVR